MGESIYKIIENLYANQAALAQSKAEIIEPYARLAAGIGALIYIFSNLITQIYQNNEINFMPLLRPFVIILLIPFAPKFCTAMDNFGEVIRSKINNDNLNIADRVRKTNIEIQKKINDKWDEIGTHPEKYDAVFGKGAYEKDESGLFGELGMDFKIGFNRISEDMKFQMMTLIQNILMALMYVAECALLLVSVGYRIVLRIGFPISLALCIFPGFTSALANWFGKYLNFALLPAVAAMYSTIAFNLVDSYVSNYNVTESMSSMGVETQQPEFLGIAFIAILILALIGYLQVPSMTAMLVSVGGVGAIVQGATRNLQSTGERGSQAANKAYDQIKRTFSSSNKR
jgi:hypothetical protein